MESVAHLCATGSCCGAQHISIGLLCFISKILVYLVCFNYLCSMMGIIQSILALLGNLLLAGFFLYVTLVLMLSATALEPYINLIWGVIMTLVVVANIIIGIILWKKED